MIKTRRRKKRSEDSTALPVVPLNVSIDEDLFNEITKEAEREERSVAGQVRFFLKRGVEHQKAAETQEEYETTP